MTILPRSASMILYAAIASFTISCHHAPSGPDESNKAFSLAITAKDGSGKPASGLRVSAYYSPTMAGLSKAPAVRQMLILASSMATFDAGSPAIVDLSLRELDGALVQQLIDHQLLRTGKYVVRLSLSRAVGTRVYVCRLNATDTSTAGTIFRDSIYVTLWQPDPAIAVLGYTDANGSLNTQDSLAFPHVLSLPPMSLTSVSPTVLGTFEFPDTVNFVLSDTASRQSVAFSRKIVRGVNTVALTWNPVSMIKLSRPSVPSPVASIVQDTAFSPTAWELYQNYPNPFN